ncbi:amino acid ABC transporter permease [Nitratireductor soli]|uniref:amino acid ABC transporter permease n=1 Tax=Nitratireductor soli TaxID=1670619 RepID=UPI00065DD739|nr:amino acid ABC transporter permease [Nitratireductor soli]
MIQSFDFSALSDYSDVVRHGVYITLLLITVGAALGLAVSILCVWARLFCPAWVRIAVTSYVEFVRNTPFLIQLFFIFFGLPQLGVSMSEMTAAIVAMAINLGAYGTEIVRAGVQATAKGQWEAATSLGMTRNQAFWRVVLMPALQKMWPTLSSQIVIVMMGSAVVSQIAVQDLTFAANFIQSRTFRAFEIYFVVTAIYIVLAALVRLALRLIGRWVLATGEVP